MAEQEANKNMEEHDVMEIAVTKEEKQALE